ncbi:type I restriction-modification system subunit M/S [Amycolatopsis solani]|uniref:type I restriction-modification system subunit M/S n=1 Tax=Amycolatopsis solani TaxID=3028615 RepID=UPI0025B07860|nr:type I restriction-modification system subunit M/S [Amycolatopsis sp. MEP2-6]
MSDLSLTDIANGAEVRLSAVSNWRARYPDFPQPRVVSGQECFDQDEVASWLRKRKIPKNRLKPDELPGATYGDRLRANVGLPGEVASALAPTSARPAPPSWSALLWSALSHLRGGNDTASALEYLLGLVYVRTCRADLWPRISAAASWPAAQAALAKVSLPTAGGQAIPVFRMFEQASDPALLSAARQIDEIDFGDAVGPESTGARIADAILAELERRMGRGGGQFTPPDVARVLVEVLEPGLSDQVYDPFCGSGELLTAVVASISRSAAASDGWRVHGQASQTWSLLTSKMNLALHGVPAEIAGPMSALEKDLFPDRRFDRILANPPFNAHLDSPAPREWRFGEPPAHNANFAWLQHVVDKLAPTGRAAVIMPTGASSQQGREQAIRRMMVESGVVECVIALPPQLFKFTGIPAMVWVLRGIGDRPGPQQVLFIDARPLGELVGRAERRLSEDDITKIRDEYRRWRDRRTFDEFRGVPGFSRAADLEVIDGNDFSLVPGRYVGEAPGHVDAGVVTRELDASWEAIRELDERAWDVRARLESALEALVAGWRLERAGQTVALGTVCDVLAGPGAVPREGREPWWTPLVLPRNIRDNRITTRELEVVPPPTAARMDRYRLKAGDVVSARTGTLGRFGLVTEEQTDWLLGPGCVGFRPNDQVNPEFLTYYLSSPAVVRWLTEHATGTAIKHVNAGTLRAMPLRLPPLPVQRAIVETLEPFRAAAALHGEISSTAERLQALVLPMLMAPEGD